MSWEVEQIGDCTLYRGDCREMLEVLGRCDALVTDPPYGVSFQGKVTKHTDKRGAASYSDTEEYFYKVVLPAIHTYLACSIRGAIFTGIRRLRAYPAPRDIGGILCPNGAGQSPWGFGCYHPVLFYGISPYLAKGLGSRPTAITLHHPGMHITGEDKIPHPCPKPLAFMTWAVLTASLPGESVCDPFAGSGTTGVACVQLGRRFIGIELERRYFDIACQRITDAYKQPSLFPVAPPTPQQLTLTEAP